jgi:ABC-type Fe3+/spermidine/putrescine transport system ATPase subunit
MSDRIAVMDHARVAQLGTPAQIYEDPRTGFVAGFIGESNFVEGKAVGENGGRTVVRRADGSTFVLPERLPAGHEVRVAIRPEWLDLFAPEQVPPGENSLPGTVRDVIYRGETIHVLVELAEGETMSVALRNEGQLSKPVSWRRGDSVAVAWLPEDCQVLEDT